MSTALVIAHPGHELRLSTWVRRERPIVHIIATGSRSGRSDVRVEASRRLANVLQATPGDVFGAAHDVDLYSWIMAGNITEFVDLADRLATAFVTTVADEVVTDGWQNYNPVHDLTHLLARAAAAEATRRTGRPITVRDYPVVAPTMGRAPCGPLVEELVLTAPEAENKRSLVKDYPEIAEDVAGLAACDHHIFVRETLHTPLALRSLMPLSRPPLYEDVGEERVRRGVYDHVLRWSHVAPVAFALEQLVTGE